jgi:flagellar basal-body rod protein FlgC
MDAFRAAQISASGMLVQKARIEAAAANIANMHSAYTTSGSGYQPVTALIRADHGSFAHALGAGTNLLALPTATLVPQGSAKPRLSYEPGHPDADPSGMVRYPAVDHTHEMMTVMTAIRAYEANLAALQATRTLAAKALEIGGQ